MGYARPVILQNWQDKRRSIQFVHHLRVALPEDTASRNS